MKLKLILDRSSEKDLSLQLYEQLRQQIVSGGISSGHRLPPSRELCLQLGVARKIVAEAYKQLLTEGFLETRKRGGSFVKDVSPATDRAKKEIAPSAKGLSNYGRALNKLTMARVEPRGNVEISLFSRSPDLEFVPSSDWFNKRFAKQPDTSSNSVGNNSLGCIELRRAVSKYILDTRGVKCSLDEVAIFQNFSQLIDVFARLHISPGDRVVVEDPCYPAMRETASAYGAKVIGVPVDECGINTNKLPKNSKQHPVRIAFLTPAHQFPRGSVLPIERRYEILEWSDQGSTLIVEDDYDSDFFFKGFAPPPLKTLPGAQFVFYVSSFKKLIPPGFAFDFAILPKQFVDVYAQAMRMAVPPASLKSQLLTAEFIESGEIQRQVRRMKIAYTRRRDILVNSLSKRFGSKVEIHGADCGLHLLVRITSDLPDAKVVTRALELGLEIETTNEFYAGDGRTGEYLLGYGNLEDDIIDEAVKRFAKAANLNRR